MMSPRWDNPAVVVESPPAIAPDSLDGPSPESSGANNAVAQRWMIEFRIHGDLRFLSHHDTLRLFRRALARADLPVRYSQGFNPHPRLSIPLPRPVGVSSDSEAVVFELTKAIDENVLLDRLGSQMPDGLTLNKARPLDERARPQPELVTYRYRPDTAPSSELSHRIRRLLESESLPVERLDNKTRRTRTIDLRSYLVDLRLEGPEIVFTVRVTGSGSARPAEIVGLLFDQPGPVNHRIHRHSIRWR